MTNLGKILAVMNLVLSLAVAAFIVMSFAARTKWHDAFDQASKQVALAQQNANAYQRQAEEANNKVEGLKKDVETCKAQEKINTDRLKGENDRLAKTLADEQSKVQDRDNTLRTSMAELQSRQREVDYLKSLAMQRDEKAKQMEQELEAAHNKATENEITRMSTQRRNDLLLVENERLTKELKKAQQNGSTAAVATTARARKNPPAEDIEGLVKATDPETGYVTLTIGSDAGLSKGNTLEAYRLKPEPAYLGTVEILAVQHDQAVAKPIARVRGTIQVGDRVSSSIVNHR